MYRIVTISLFACLILACRNSPGEKQEGSGTNKASLLTRAEVLNDTWNIGKIKQGEIVTHTFTYTNTGENGLIIKKIETSCGCTVPKYNKKPVKPGESGQITVEFNSKGRLGKQYKVMHVYANIPEKVFQLVVTADIRP